VLPRGRQFRRRLDVRRVLLVVTGAINAVEPRSARTDRAPHGLIWRSGRTRRRKDPIPRPTAIMVINVVEVVGECALMFLIPSGCLRLSTGGVVGG
jgi:hypothetical protein